jgi:hypothetical protein
MNKSITIKLKETPDGWVFVVNGTKNQKTTDKISSVHKFAEPATALIAAEQSVNRISDVLERF